MYRSIADIEAEIEDLKELRSSGMASDSGDGWSRTYRSLDDLNATIKQLEREKDQITDDTPTTAYRSVSFKNGSGF